MKHVIMRSMILASTFALTACVDTSDQDLRQWVANEKAKPATGIEPLPEIRPYEAFIYSAEH